MTASSISHSTIPTIFLNSPDKTETAAKLRKACIETGFFYLDGHNIPIHFLDEVFQQSKKLFKLPLTEKETMTDKISNRGYTYFEEEVLDVSVQTERGDTKEGFYIAKHITEEDEDYNPKKFRSPNVYPDTSNSGLDDPTKFRETIDSYYDQMSKLGFKVVQLFALALNLPENHFNEYFDKNPLAILRLLHYSREKSDPSNGIFACGAHSDYGMLTLLLTDSNPGLQILYKNEWIPVPPKRGLILIHWWNVLMDVGEKTILKSTKL